MSNPFATETKQIAGGKITVYPLAIRHLPLIKPLAKRLGSILANVAKLKGEVDMHARLVEMIADEGLDFSVDAFNLIAACCEPNIDPNAHLGFVAEAAPVWWELSFESEQSRPMVALVEKTIQRLTGQTISFSTIRSTFLSALDTTSKTSSTESETAGLTPDGVSSSSTEGSKPVTEHTGEASPKTLSRTRQPKAKKPSAASEAMSIP